MRKDDFLEDDQKQRRRRSVTKRLVGGQVTYDRRGVDEFAGEFSQ